MTHIEQAIRDAVESAAREAIEAGYKPVPFKFDTIVASLEGMFFVQFPKARRKTSYEVQVFYAEMFLDPAFWQALGKARGWRKYRHECGEYFDMIGLIQCPRCLKVGSRYAWLDNWVRFVLHLSDGKDAESFFASLV